MVHREKKSKKYTAILGLYQRQREASHKNDG